MCVLLNLFYQAIGQASHMWGTILTTDGRARPPASGYGTFIETLGRPLGLAKVRGERFERSEAYATGS